MNMQKKLLTITAGLLLSATALQANEALFIQSASSTPHQLELADIRYITFTASEMVVTPRSGAPIFFALNGLSFSFDGGNLTIESPTNTPVLNSNDFSVYVTPQGEVRITGEAQVLSITVFDTHGRQLMSSNSDRLNISALPRAVYLLVIETTQGFAAQKIIKQH